jgi:hypothetical protein
MQFHKVRFSSVSSNGSSAYTQEETTRKGTTMANNKSKCILPICVYFITDPGQEILNKPSYYKYTLLDRQHVSAGPQLCTEEFCLYFRTHKIVLLIIYYYSYYYYYHPPPQALESIMDRGFQYSPPPFLPVTSHYTPISYFH